ncbi:RsiV family protein [Acinetobacter indicus]|uniref:RsiV family protein n=1 Tax=Acinetobacter indicus TaxID=756892 RepID=UPI003989E183
MQHLKSNLLTTTIALTTVLMLSACQPKQDAAPQVEAEQSQTQAAAIPVIQAKVVPVELKQQQRCDEEGCTEYDIQTVNTNVPWINAYFMQRIKKADPIAFSEDAASTASASSASSASEANSTEEPNRLSLSSTYVRYIGQHGRLATFSMQSYSYPAGAAHGMHHQEFVTFDLNSKKRLALQDILLPNSEAKLVQELFNHNYNWLNEHDIQRDKLRLSDNFYYGANGLVFVYPLYELASYAEGMPELELPYYAVDKLIKAEYLPSLPKYPAQ